MVVFIGYIKRGLGLVFVIPLTAQEGVGPPKLLWNTWFCVEINDLRESTRALIIFSSSSVYLILNL